MQIDPIDRRLLTALQADARTPIAALAERVGASVASVQRRLRRLRESGVIQREIAVIDPKILGFTVTAVVLVELERDRLDEVEGFKRRARAEPQVQQCYCVAGDVDFVVVAVARDLPDYEALTHRLFFQDANVRKFRTMIVYTTEKSGATPPLPEPPAPEA